MIPGRLAISLVLVLVIWVFYFYESPRSAERPDAIGWFPNTAERGFSHSLFPVQVFNETVAPQFLAAIHESRMIFQRELNGCEGRKRNRYAASQFVNRDSLMPFRVFLPRGQFDPIWEDDGSHVHCINDCRPKADIHHNELDLYWLVTPNIRSNVNVLRPYHRAVAFLVEAVSRPPKPSGNKNKTQSERGNPNGCGADSVFASNSLFPVLGFALVMIGFGLGVWSGEYLYRDRIFIAAALLLGGWLLGGLGVFLSISH